MSFLIYDIIICAIFTILTLVFLYVKRKNLKKDGILFLYRTQIGLKLIDWFGKKHAKWLRPLQYLVITCGYALMVLMTYLLARLSYFYFSSLAVPRALKVPVVFPLIPYLPEIFKIDFLPPFYFATWIIVLAIIAIPHEFAHGIFAKLNKIKIKSTGFGFLGPLLFDLGYSIVKKAKKATKTYFIICASIVAVSILLNSYILLLLLVIPFLAAFVEQDDRQMQKSSKFAQLSVLAAGTFANILFTILFTAIIWLFFALSFSPAGTNFNFYATSIISSENISEINHVQLSEFNLDSLPINDSEFINFKTYNNKSYYVTVDIIKEVYNNQNVSYISAFDDAPAFKAKLAGAILEFDGEKVVSYEQLRTLILKHRPGDNIIIESLQNNEIKEFNITLANNNGSAYLGVGFQPIKVRGIIGLFAYLVPQIDDFATGVHYESKIGEFGIFIYNLLWWIVIACLSVALTNMLPVGIFDGGRFFMLTIWGITGSRKAGERAFKWVTIAFIVLVIALMIQYAISISIK